MKGREVLRLLPDSAISAALLAMETQPNTEVNEQKLMVMLAGEAWDRNLLSFSDVCMKLGEHAQQIRAPDQGEWDGGLVNED